MINASGMILGILISSLWIFLPLKRVPEEIRMKKSKYITAIIAGATLCTLLIIILESIWDKLTGIPVENITTLSEAAACSFTRAALLEEGEKYLFVRHALKKNKPQGRLQYMLLSGAIGMGYGITEKLVMASAASMLFDAVFSLHTMFQFIMGWYLYEAAIAEDAAKKKACNIKAFLVPFVIHGVWDCILFGTGVYITGEEMTALSVTALLLMVAAVIAAFIGEVRMALYLKRVKV